MTDLKSFGESIVQTIKVGIGLDIHCRGGRRGGPRRRSLTTDMSLVSRPEQMRTNATRSRCARSMFDWILKMNPLKRGPVPATSPIRR